MMGDLGSTAKMCWLSFYPFDLLIMINYFWLYFHWCGHPLYGPVTIVPKTESEQKTNILSCHWKTKTSLTHHFTTRRKSSFLVSKPWVMSWKVGFRVEKLFHTDFLLTINKYGKRSNVWSVANILFYIYIWQCWQTTWKNDNWNVIAMVNLETCTVYMKPVCLKKSILVADWGISLWAMSALLLTHICSYRSTLELLFDRSIFTETLICEAFSSRAYQFSMSFM